MQGSVCLSGAIRTDEFEFEFELELGYPRPNAGL